MSIQFYEDNAEAFFRGSVAATLLPEQKRFAGLVPPGGRILDAGCGSGRDVKVFREWGFEVTATEAAPKLAALAQAHSGVAVQVMTFDQMAWREAFDGVWACASLLHVARARLPATVRRLVEALGPGGVLFMSFKYGTEERNVGGRRFTDLNETGAHDLLAQVGALELLSLDVTEDVRQERAGERWLSVFCRRGG